MRVDAVAFEAGECLLPAEIGQGFQTSPSRRFTSSSAT
jgi:hypothetical protein